MTCLSNATFTRSAILAARRTGQCGERNERHSNGEFRSLSFEARSLRPSDDQGASAGLPRHIYSTDGSDEDAENSVRRRNELEVSSALVTLSYDDERRTTEVRATEGHHRDGRRQMVECSPRLRGLLLPSHDSCRPPFAAVSKSSRHDSVLVRP